MATKRKVNIVDLLLVITIILFVYEFVFSGPGLLLLVGLILGLTYIGKKRIHKTHGKVMFWVGIVLLIITVMNTMAFKFFILSVLVYFLYKFYKAKKEPIYHQPRFNNSQQGKEVVEEKVLFTNKWFGKQHTETFSFEWNDINIQAGIGDTIIDLNYTMIPEGEPIIFIRNIFGNVQILVPFDVEVSIHHSVLFGSMAIIDHYEDNVFNRVVRLQTANYLQSKQKVKIVTSMLVGKIEVSRI